MTHSELKTKTIDALAREFVERKSARVSHQVLAASSSRGQKTTHTHAHTSLSLSLSIVRHRQPQPHATFTFTRMADTQLAIAGSCAEDEKSKQQCVRAHKATTALAKLLHNNSTGPWMYDDMEDLDAFLKMVQVRLNERTYLNASQHIHVLVALQSQPNVATPIVLELVGRIVLGSSASHLQPWQADIQCVPEHSPSYLQRRREEHMTLRTAFEHQTIPDLADICASYAIEPPSTPLGIFQHLDAVALEFLRTTGFWDRGGSYNYNLCPIVSPAVCGADNMLENAMPTTTVQLRMDSRYHEGSPYVEVTRESNGEIVYRYAANLAEQSKWDAEDLLYQQQHGHARPAYCSVAELMDMLRQGVRARLFWHYRGFGFAKALDRTRHFGGIRKIQLL